MKRKVLCLVLLTVLSVTALSVDKAVDGFKDMVTCAMIDNIVSDFSKRVGDEGCVEYVPLSGMMKNRLLII